MAGPIISKLLTDFFNEIGPKTFSSLRRNHTSEVGGEADMEDIKREGGYNIVALRAQG